MSSAAPGRTLWSPPDNIRDVTRLGRFADLVQERTGRTMATYDDLLAWSVEEPGAFWTTVIEFFDLPHSGALTPALARAEMPFAQWFPHLQLNFAEAMLQLPGRADDDLVVLARSDTRPDGALTAAQLRDQVARARRGLQELGVSRGDRVAAYLPNIPEALVLLLATASLGAIFTSCPPEFGVTNVIDRWAQISPTLVVAVDGYRYGEKAVDRRAEVAEIADQLSLADRVVWLPYLDSAWQPSGLTWDALLATSGPLEFDPVSFDHPLWVLFSSGTTGAPKPIVHGHGGITVELAKSLGLHLDLGPDDTFFWFSTTGWMMWNFLVGGLLVGSQVVLYDGNPGGQQMAVLWRLAGDYDVTFFGVSAPFVMQCRKVGLVVSDHCDPTRIREIGSTGAPLPADGFDWLATHVGPHLRVNSLSGGTDVCTAFVGGTPWLPIRAGEISGAYLGCRVESWSPEGTPLIGEVGEMVVTAPIPSMPVMLWGDTSGERYRRSYFEPWPGVWRHGDWLTIAADGSMVISGRSDATLNRGGVRLGTAEFYRVVENLPGVADSLVVHLEDNEGGAGELIVFVVPTAPAAYDAALGAEIAAALRSQLSPRHVPDTMVGVRAIPRTLSGKKLEVPVKRILQGAEPHAVADPGALVDPSALDDIVMWRDARS